MNTLFTWSNPQVKKLLGWRTGSEEEKWAEKAVESLVKKLKKKKSGPGTIEDLEMALANPTSLSKCVTIPKSLDGRLQVSHKKGLPHVIYCKVWRWPDLQSHQELRSIPECAFPYEMKADHICINPYHYQKIENPHKPFFQSATTIGGQAASPYSDACASGSKYIPGQSSPPLPMQIPSPMGSSYSTASPFSSASSYQSPCSILSEDESPDRMVVSESPAAYPMIELPPAPTHLPVYWTTINYYELNTRIGEAFKIANRSVVVDGFTDPTNSDSRICLGQITNVNRNSTCENTRKAIGRGLKLDYTPESDLHVTNQSGNSLFVQSILVNIKLNKSHGTVMRIPTGHSLCIFEHQIFFQLLQQARQRSQAALYDMQRMAFIRISFVKGWGPDYPTRQDITCTPCWIEIQLHQALAWIDQSLRIETPPEKNCNSDTI
ncbi:hypothetical protein PMAYCL1PPCAC_13398 [Pristionchus mayeri]|uniref:Mothers against decapentaplegic homolog n=1 Tax=Pristionchus mayeri TaxID=1317129 RepID=A0AAN5C9R3_9BILA|nr:hypothetical protein PMAYCL1PPCAC_13398 [Pristionchus mayeri]